MKASGSGVPCTGLHAPCLTKEALQPGGGAEAGAHMPPWLLLQRWGSLGGLWSDAAGEAVSSCGSEGRRRERRNQSLEDPALGTLDLRGLVTLKAQLSAVVISALYLVNYLRNIHVFQGYVAWHFFFFFFNIFGCTGSWLQRASHVHLLHGIQDLLVAAWGIWFLDQG